MSTFFWERTFQLFSLGEGKETLGKRSILGLEGPFPKLSRSSNPALQGQVPFTDGGKEIKATQM